MPGETDYYPDEFHYYKDFLRGFETSFKDSKHGDIKSLDEKVFRFIFDLKYKDEFGQFIEDDFKDGSRLIKELKRVSSTLSLVLREREKKERTNNGLKRTYERISELNDFINSMDKRVYQGSISRYFGYSTFSCRERWIF